MDVQKVSCEACITVQRQFRLVSGGAGCKAEMHKVPMALSLYVHGPHIVRYVGDGEV